jgi:TonB-linked SusC/RagA family outer membrane protein
MKKKWIRDALLFGIQTKMWKIMRLNAIFLLLCFSHAWALSGYSQETKLTLKMSDSKIIDVLDAIEEQSEFFFLFNQKLVDVERKVDIDVQEKSIDFILQKLFAGTNVNHMVIDRQIVLTTFNEELLPQQQRTVSGKVTDSSGQPLPGATVVVKGTTQGTVTNADGEYSLSNIPDDATLVFSFVGMRTQEIQVGDQTSINVILEEETIGIEEVVAVGYGTMRRQAVTGAVAEANLEPFENVPVNNIAERIKGSVPGLNVGGINQAGQIGDLSIRGQNSTAASNNPLIVVDGVIFSGSLGDIASEDIESLTVLKDASAAAVYGSRAANGVIIIETKMGAGVEGKPMFNVKMSYGISDMMKPLEVYDAEGYIQRLLDIRALNGLEADPSKISIYLQAEEQKNYEATPDHRPTLEDPFSLTSQMGHNINTTVSVSNKTDKTSYYISTSLIDQKGVVINDAFKHISGRVNIDSDLTDWFNLGIKSFYSSRDYSGDSPGMHRATHFSPYASVYNEDGTYKQFPQTTTSFNSPFWEIATEDTDIRNNLNGIISSVIKVPWVEGLSYQVTFSNALNWTERNWFFNEYTIDGKGKSGIGQRQYSRDYSMLLDNLIKFNRTFNKIHNTDITLLYSREHSSWENLVGYAENFENTILGTYKLENALTQSVNTGGGETNGIGLMARGTYTYNYKYSLTGTIRRDGYSAFSKNKKWGVFPSVGLNWNISREGFMERADAINNLALRASYGTNGNQSISAYSTLARMGSDKYIFAGDPSYTITQYISTLANNNLGWESTTGLNLGLDFSLFDNRIRGTIDGYKTRTNDLMFELSLPKTSGKNSITSNLGEIQNKGIEVYLHTLNIAKNDFNWSSDFTFSLNRNKIVTIFGEDNDGDGKEDDLISDGYFIGKSLGTIYDYKVIGMWQQEDKDAGTIMQGMRPGDYKLEDVDGDGSITSEEDRQFLGNYNPNFRWSWSNTMEYKNFTLMMYFYSIWGGDGWFLSDNNTPYLDAYSGNAALNRPVYDYWTPQNTDAKFPRPDYQNAAAYKGTKYIDRSFIKLQKVSLTYNATGLVQPWGINGLSFSLSADNLFTYAPHWVGLDPETDEGLTDHALPSIRTYLFTVSLNF